MSDMIEEQKVRAVLRRLLAFYAGRGKSCIEQARKAIDVASMQHLAVQAACWDARSDTVVQIAEELEISFDEEVIGRE